MLLTSYTEVPVLGSQIKWIKISFHPHWSVFNIAILKQSIWINKNITYMFIHLSRDSQHFPNFILSIHQCSNRKCIFLTSVYQVTAWSLFYSSWNETFLSKWTDTIVSYFQIYHWNSFGQQSKGYFFSLHYWVQTNAQQVIHYFYISFHLRDNISLKLFMLTSKIKHFAVLKSQELFTPQNTQGANYYLQHTENLKGLSTTPSGT